MENNNSPFITRYAEAQSMLDMGERLFALNALAAEMGAKYDALRQDYDGIEGKIKGRSTYVGMAVGGAGSVFLMVLAAPVTVPLAGVVAMSALFGTFGGHFGGLFGTLAGTFIQTKDHRRCEAKMKEASTLWQDIREKADFIIQQEDLKTLAVSKKYKEVLCAFPHLRERFENATKQETENLRLEVMRDAVLKHDAPPQKKPPKPFNF